uniref:Uncharacterized protein n=1 Tax=Corvus moneduloides TaxID=1196302 RepID=A0A8C3EAG8_CORMO
ARMSLPMAGLYLLGGTGAQDMCGDPPATPSHSVPAPQLSPEERLSPHMPESLRCDACHAIAFQVGTEDTGRTEGCADRSPAREQGRGQAATLTARIPPFFTPD